MTLVPGFEDLPYFGDPAAAEEPVSIWAGGGVITRRKRREILLAHRPRRDDWSMPKGKQDPGETLIETALREVLEETGLVCRLRSPLAMTRYFDGAGRTKAVAYWHMTVESGEFVVNDEVDSVEWLAIDKAICTLTYSYDQALLAHLADVWAKR